MTKQDAIQIADKTRQGLGKIYGQRLRGVYLYGSAARDQLDSESDIDIAIVLDEIPDRFAEHERTSRLGSQLSLQENTLISILFISEADFKTGRFAIHGAIKEEGIRA
jgi:predicted nucleotidyltransferase